jgi:uncharacterized protein
VIGVNILNMITFILTAVGALNWGLFAFDFNLIHTLFGSAPVLEKAIYILVGLSGIYQAVTYFSGNGRIRAP